MKLLWLCNMIPAVIQAQIDGSAGSGLWVDHVLKDIREKTDIRIHVLCPYRTEVSGALDERCSYGTYVEPTPERYFPWLEKAFEAAVRDFQPDVIHIWGTEFGHTLAMVDAADVEGMLSRVVISIQGLCSVYANHYTEGLPHRLIHAATFRDILRLDNIARQQEKFACRGELEVAALERVSHVIGRTDWDEACTGIINPQRQYHKCNETLRPVFYSGQWAYETCRKHRIFASSSMYPVKGFHYLLEAFAEVLKKYPDATLAVPGKAPCTGGFNQQLRVSSYEKYLRRLLEQYDLTDKVEFLGRLSAEDMKRNYLEANVFALPSTIENSPNSLGEAMLLGVPCVTADVGGVTTMLRHGEEGYVYQSTAPYMLAYYIQKVFAMEDAAGELGQKAHSHAAVTHDPQTNLLDLLAIYSHIRDTSV